MEPLIAFVNTETNGLHKKYFKKTKCGMIEEIPNIEKNKKNLYLFANLISINYSIGIYTNNKFDEKINKKFLFNPKKFVFSNDGEKIHGYSKEHLLKKGKSGYEILNEFINDIKHVNFIIFHCADYHIKAIQAELIRNCILFDFNNYKIIDINSFNHNLIFPSLKTLAETYLTKISKNKLKIIRKIFFKLYNNYIESIK